MGTSPVLLLIGAITLVYLFLCARSDLKTRSIRTFPALIMACGGLIFHLLLTAASSPADARLQNTLVSLLQYGIGAGLGLLLMFLSFASRSSIGYGDGLAVCAAGALLGFSDESACLLLGLFFSAAWSLILLIRKKASRNDTIPFLPFLFAGHAVLISISAVRSFF